MLCVTDCRCGFQVDSHRPTWLLLTTGLQVRHTHIHTFNNDNCIYIVDIEHKWLLLHYRSGKSDEFLDTVHTVITAVFSSVWLWCMWCMFEICNIGFSPLEAKHIKTNEIHPATPWLDTYPAVPVFWPDMTIKHLQVLRILACFVGACPGRLLFFWHHSHHSVILTLINISPAELSQCLWSCQHFHTMVTLIVNVFLWRNAQ